MSFFVSSSVSAFKYQKDSWPVPVSGRDIVGLVEYLPNMHKDIGQG